MLRNTIVVEIWRPFSGSRGLNTMKEESMDKMRALTILGYILILVFGGLIAFYFFIHVQNTRFIITPTVKGAVYKIDSKIGKIGFIPIKIAVNNWCICFLPWSSL